jgi:hypothetical protein
MKASPAKLAAKASFFMVAVLVLATGCVTKVREVDLTGNILVDGPRAIAEGPPRDKVLWEYRLASAELRTGNDAEAKRNLDDALARLGGIYGKDASAKKARSYFAKENEKTFIGEPYERVMAYYYRGILYWMDGEADNARACFRSGEIEDSSSEGEQYSGDYVLLDYLDGLASTKLGDDGSDAFKRSQDECKVFTKPPPYNPKANVLFFVEFGPGPHKYATGRYHEELHFSVPVSPVRSAVIHVDNMETMNLGPYDDLGFQATTRGGRVMDHVLGNKAVFKASTDAAGNAAILGGAATAATVQNQTGAEVGLGLIAAGIITKIVSAKTTPAADTRTWGNLPRYLSFGALQLAPGTHTAVIEFRGDYGQVLPNFTKTFTLTVPTEKRDKVVFVSDASQTPQS